MRTLKTATKELLAIVLVALFFASCAALIITDPEAACSQRVAHVAVQDGRTTQDAYDYGRLVCRVNGNDYTP